MSDDAKSAQVRRAAITSQIQAETGIDEAMIERLVRDFYVRVRSDAVLGPNLRREDRQLGAASTKDVCLLVFRCARERPISWPAHGEAPPLPVDARHFDRWLTVFAETARDVCPPAAAERFIFLSHRVGESFERGIANSNGVLFYKGQRYFRVGKSPPSCASGDCNSVDDNQGTDTQ